MNVKNWLNFLKLDKEIKNKEKIDSTNLQSQEKATPIKELSEKEIELKKLEDIEKIEDRKIRAEQKSKSMPKEYGYKFGGPEPTRYGDWEVKGKCSDF